MRVSIINLNLDARGAIGQCMLHQLRYFRRRGDDVYLYVTYPAHGVPEEIHEFVRVVDLGSLMAREDAHFAQSDLYVYHYPGRYEILESIKGIERGAVILNYHNVTPPELWGSEFARDLLRHSIDTVGEIAGYADLVVADSAFSAEELVEEHGCEPERVRVLPLAVPLADFSPGPADVELVRQYGLEGRTVILFVGRMAGNKRVDLLIDALPQIRERIPDAALLLVGDDRGNPALQETTRRAKERAETLGVAEHVIFTGPVEEVAPFFRLASLYATASLHEGFGVPLIEAMASGVPVVASRATAHPWVLGEAGLLVEPDDAGAMADAITRLLTNDSLYGTLVRRGLERARDFSIDRYEAGWGEIVAEATKWLPEQPTVPPLSLESTLSTSQPPASPASRPEAPGPYDEIRRVMQQAWMAHDVRIQGYVVRSKIPIVGRLIAWVRRNLTSHLREPYLDPIVERQTVFNQRVAELLERIARELPGFEEAGIRSSGEYLSANDVATRLRQLEAQMALLSAQVALLQARQGSELPEESLEPLQAQIEQMRSLLGGSSPS